jgi:anaerobic magnesium-protoporphyrin IX monomethyl ester cyclase
MGASVVPREIEPMKIALVYPYCLEDRIHIDDVHVPPIGLYFIGATLIESGHDVTVFNWGHMRGRESDMQAALQQASPDIIGFSVLQANRWGAIDIARWAKSMFPRVKVVFGGIAATTMWRQFLHHFPEVDAVVVGEGERAFLDLVRFYEDAGGDDAPAGIPGVAHRRDGDFRLTPPRVHETDLDQLPDPSRYFTYNHVLLGRGCPGNCTFCGSPEFWGRRVRFHSPQWFVDQLERLVGRGQRFFYFSDDTFTLKRCLVLEVCKEIRKRRLDIQWAAISRVDRMDEELAKAMRLAGCIQISFGVESGSPRIRRLLGKPFTDAQIKRAFDIVSRMGILTRAYFIYGCPGENEETIGQTLSLMDAIRPLGAIFYILSLFPGTRLYQDVITPSGIKEDALWLQPIEDVLYHELDQKLSGDQVLAFGKTLRQHFHRHLPRYINALELIDDPELSVHHADFYSRLAMTLDHGDYAAIADIPGKPALAEALYRRSLDYAPNARAYLGLGIQLQKGGGHDAAIRLLSDAVAHFPNHEPLNLCLAISHMNTGRFSKALLCLEKFETSPQALGYMAECHRRLGNTVAAADCDKRMTALTAK